MATSRKRKTASAASATETPGKATHVTVGKHNVKLGTPRQLVPSMLVRSAAQHNLTLAFAAALGICWESGGTPNAPAKWAQFGNNTMSYGGAVLESLLRAGVLPVDIDVAGTVAWMHLTDLLPKAEEVADAEDFSEAATGASTS